VPDPADVPPAIVAKLQAVCRELPEVDEEAAWVGLRWRIRTKTFAHVLTVAGAKPPGYARLAGTDGPVTLLMFRSSGPELASLQGAGPPFLVPPWRGNEIGIVLDDATDWDEVRELVTESYCLRAPKKLAERVARPAEPDATP
jgi:predicted DNA-binding protein (MmcQ/YjbR family)